MTLPDKRPGRKTLRYLGMIVLTVGFLWLAFRNADLEKTVEVLQKIRWLWLILAMGVLGLVNVVRAYRWQIIYDKVKPDISLIHYLSGICLGNLFNFAVPRSGDVVRLFNFSRYGETPLSSALSTVILERVLDTLTLFVFLGAMLLVFSDQLAAIDPYLGISGWTVLPVAGIILLTLGLASKYAETVSELFGRIAGFILKRVRHRVKEISFSFLIGCRVLLDIGKYFAILFTSLLSFFVYGLTFLMVFQAFPMDQLNLLDAMIVMTLSTVGLAAQAPMGSGFHFFCILSLTEIQGVSTDVATAYSISYLAVMGVGNLLFAVLVFGVQWLGGHSQKRIPPDIPSDHRQADSSPGT